MNKKSLKIFSIFVLLSLLTLITCLGKHDSEIKYKDYMKRLVASSPLMGHAFEKLSDPEFVAKAAAEIKKLHATPEKQKEYAANDDRVPLIILPPLLGTKLHAKLNKTQSEYSYCYKKTHDFFVLWLDVFSFVPYKMECFFEDMSVQYTTKDGFSNYPGVTTRIDDVGGVSSVDYVDNLRELGVFNELIKLLKTYGYQERKDLRAFPYDWRVAPIPRTGKTSSKPKSADSLDVWEQYAKLKELVEETYEINGQKKVAFSTLSLGGNYLNLFFAKYVDASWKAKYVHSFTSFCAPWGGSSEAVEFNLHPPKHQWIPVIPIPQSLKYMSRNLPSVTWLWPRKNAFGNDILVKSPTRTIKANLTEITNMWLEMKQPKLAEWHQKVEEFSDQVAPEGVRHICVYSTNLTTIYSLEFQTDDFTNDEFNMKHPPKRTMVDGDTTVPYNSLSLCKKWPGTEVHVTPDVSHGSDMHDARNLKILMDVLGLKPAN